MRVLFLFFCLTPMAHALSWQDLWVTHDQQAKKMMEDGQFSTAKETFERKDWQAAAAYRAGDYDKAAKLYSSLKSEEADYNKGNALAHTGKYEQAIDAYDKTLAIYPNHQDALHNRKIVEGLLKKEKQNDQNKKDQNKNNQNKDEQSQKDQDKNNQDKNDQDKNDQDKKDQDKKDQDKKDQDKKDQDKAAVSASSSEQREQQQEKDQWLRLIPDDPGGLLREKFMRDHLRRQRGWGQ
jgi:Ca-activated chloride channel family protein